MDRRDLELSRPCPIDLDSLGVDRSQERVFCSHCSAHVTDISKMREAEAAAFVAAKRGSGVCISYLCDREGNVRFADSELGGAELGALEVPASMRPAPPLVPLARLRRPAARRAAALAALALAACTPHGEHDEPYVESVDDIVMERTSPEIPLAEKPSELPPVEEPAEEVAEVGETPELAEEPCGPEVRAEAETQPRKRQRGKLARAKTVPDWDRVDGGI